MVHRAALSSIRRSGLGVDAAENIPIHFCFSADAGGVESQPALCVYLRAGAVVDAAVAPVCL